MINILCTSAPADGLLHYSYEYCCLLNESGIDARLVIITNPNFSGRDYVLSIQKKYSVYENIVIDSMPEDGDITMVLGRSMITLPYLNRTKYSPRKFSIIMELLSGKVISVYSENHPVEYRNAIDFFDPESIVDLCDHEVYPNGVGIDFKKTINFKIYKEFKEVPQFTHLFLGTNKEYYESALKHINDYPDSAILTYRNSSFIRQEYNHVYAPMDNLLGAFVTYVYVKESFDPAPRLIQECKYFGKGVVYLRDPSIKDGGSVYWNRDNEEPEIDAIVKAIETLK